jgi:uncharacterized repeat protein (TIGR01451 family)
MSANHGRRGIVLGLSVLCLAAGIPAPAQPRLTASITTDRTRVNPGELLALSVSVGNPGLGAAADFYVGARLPDGVTVVSFGPGLAPALGTLSNLATLVPAAANVSLATPFSVNLAPFLERVLTGTEPPGRYLFFLAAVQAGALQDGALGAGELLALSTVEVTAGAPLTPTLDPALAATALIPTEGGTLQATAADGTRLTLTIPPGALSDATQITLTPVTAIANLLFTGGLLGAARLEPEGLQLAQPASLTLALPAPVSDPGRVFGFLYDGLGANFDLLPVQVSGSTLSLPVAHFSTAGAAVVNPEDVPELIDQILGSGRVLPVSGPLTLPELEALAQAVGLALLSGQDAEIDLARVSEVVRLSLAPLVDEACAATPSKAGLDQLTRLDSVQQRFADVSIPRIRECQETALRPLIEQARDAVLANPTLTNPQLAELQNSMGLICQITLKDYARCLGFRDLELLALQAFETAMRSLTQGTLDQVTLAQGTPQEGQVRQQAITDLEAALTYVTTTAAEVLTVAPTLDDDIQAAIDSLRLTGTMTVLIRDGSGVRVETSVDVPGQDTTCENRAQVTTFPGVPPPISFSAQCVRVFGSVPFHAGMSLSVEQNGNVLVFSATGFVTNQDAPLDDTFANLDDSTADGSASLVITFPRPGTVTTQINTAWLSQIDGVNASARISGTVFYNFADPGDPDNSTTSTLDVSGPIDAGLGVKLHCGETSFAHPAASCTIQGSGEIGRITYTPR